MAPGGAKGRGPPGVMGEPAKISLTGYAPATPWPSSVPPLPPPFPSAAPAGLDELRQAQAAHAAQAWAMSSGKSHELWAMGAGGYAGAWQDPYWQEPVKLARQDFLGRWVDSLGHAVQVTASSSGIYKDRLLVKFSKADEEDYNCSLVEEADPYSGLKYWRCGSAFLDVMLENSIEQVHWTSTNGPVSVWIRLPEAKADEPPGSADTTAIEVSSEEASGDNEAAADS